MKYKINKWFKELFCDKEFYKKLFIIAFPITLQNLITSSLNMVDILMVGQLGENAIAAVGLANQMFLLILMAIIGVSSGISVFISQFWGKKDIENIHRMLGIALISSVGIATISTIFVAIYPKQIMKFFTLDSNVIELGISYLLFVCVSYIFTAITFVYNFSLRSIGQTTISMLVSIVAVLINVLCNYIFIFGNFGAPALGVAGAALGTTIARVCETFMLVGFIYWKKGVLAARFSQLVDISKELVFKISKPVTLVLLNEMFWGSGTVVYAAAYGHINADATAAVQISNTVTNFCTVMIFGMSSAAATMVGNKIGEGDEEGGRLYAKRIAIIASSCGVIISILLALLAAPIVTIFFVSPQVAKSSEMILYITAIILTLRVFNIIMIVGVLRGGGDAKAGLIIEGGTMWLVGVPMALIGVFWLHWPVEAVVALVALEEVTKCICCLYRFVSGKWVHNIIANLAPKKATSVAATK